MATVINAGDVQLAATSPRLITVSLPGNVEVPAVKSIKLTATNTVFKFAAGSTTPSNFSTITVTANLIQLSGTVVFEVIEGSSQINVTGNSFTVTYNTMLTDSITVEARLTVGGVTYSDVIDIVKVFDGAAGVAGLNIVLSNDSHVIPTDSAGQNGVYAGATSTVSVYQGSTDESANWTFSATGSNTTFTFVDRVITVSALSADTGYVEILATRTGYSSLSVRFTLSKARGGITGQDATAYWIVSNAAAIQKTIAGVYTPETIVFFAYSATGTTTPALYAGRFIIATSTDGSTYTNQVTSSVNESSISYVIPANIKTVRASLYLAGDTVTLVDQEVVPVVSDGATGATGNTGTRGNISAAIGGQTVWSDTVANNYFNTTYSGVKVMNDAITQYGTNFSQTRFWNATSSTWIIADAYINGNLLVDGTLGAGKIQSLSITAGQIASNAITADKILAGAITTAKMNANTINANVLLAGSITATEIAAGAVTTAKMNAGTINANVLLAGSITATQIGANQVTAAKINGQNLVVYAGSYNGSYNWPASGGGFNLSSSGLLLGNYNNTAGGYAQIDSTGFFSLGRRDGNHIGFDPVTGNWFGSNAIINSTLTNNAVSTSKILNNAVTASSSGSLSGPSDNAATWSFNVTITAGAFFAIWFDAGQYRRILSIEGASPDTITYFDDAAPVEYTVNTGYTGGRIVPNTQSAVAKTKGMSMWSVSNASGGTYSFDMSMSRPRADTGATTYRSPPKVIWISLQK